MTHKIAKQCIRFLILFFASVHMVHAGFEITEVVYDLDGTDTDREWIEVQNTGSEDTDLSQWYFFSDNTKHSLAPETVAIVPAGSYAIIAQKTAKFKTDWPSFSGLLFDSSWTGFNNETESIALKDIDLNIVSPVTIASSIGGSGNGDSLQKINDAWAGAHPTPGMQNSVGNSSNSSPSNPTPSDSPVPETVISSSSPSPAPSTTVSKKEKEPDPSKFTATIIAKNTVFAGVPFLIDARIVGSNKETVASGRFVWNFGDGMSSELKNQKEFKYTFSYPGDYALSLSYYGNYSQMTPDVVAHMTIKAVPLEVSISSVGTDTDAFVELENKSAYEVPLSDWQLASVAHSFIFPEGTVLLPNKKLKFSSRVTQLSGEDVKSLSLKNPNGEIISSYPLFTASAPAIVPVLKSQARTRSNAAPQTATPLKNSNQVINLNDLGASASDAPTKEISQKTLAWLGLVGIIILGSASIFLIRHKKNPVDGDASQISAEDMTIEE